MSDDWETPPWILRLVFRGREFYDPCPLFGEGGLTSNWPNDRPVFINPPYSNPRPWVDRAYRHKGEVHLLLPLDPTTEWWRFYAPEFNVVVLPFRLQFRGRFVKGQKALSGEDAMMDGRASFRGTSFACSWWYKDSRSSPAMAEEPM